ncbi:MAG: pitrilysin family protein [Pseudomonadota bacterium]|nr:pitrilysin family protein [Pseudomonadota bacterium]
MKTFTIRLLAVIALAGLTAPAGATEVQRVISPGGIEAWLVEEHSIPILSLRASFRGGAAFDQAGREGTATMASSLIDEGAGGYDSQAFQTRLEDLSVRISFSAGLDTFGATLKTLSENTDEAFELLRLAMTEPRFDEEPVERIRGQYFVHLARQAEDPNYLVGRAWYTMAFPGHPYSRPLEGTPETMAAITADDMRAFMAAQLARDRVYIGVVGDSTPERLRDLLDSTFGGLPAIGAPAETVVAAPGAPGTLTVIDRDIPQSIALFGGAGLERHDPDYYAAYIMNYILGGSGFTSRLTEEVRNKRGLAYSVYTYLAPMDYSAIHIGQVATQNNAVAESLDIIRAELARMRDHGVTAEELADAKTYLTGSFPLRLDSNGKIASLLVGIQFEDLGIDYIDRRNSYMEAVTLDDVNRMARRLLKPEALQIIVIGRPEGLSGN